MARATWLYNTEASNVEPQVLMRVAVPGGGGAPWGEVARGVGARGCSPSPGWNAWLKHAQLVVGRCGLVWEGCQTGLGILLWHIFFHLRYASITSENSK